VNVGRGGGGKKRGRQQQGPGEWSKDSWDYGETAVSTQYLTVDGPCSGCLPVSGFAQGSQSSIQLLSKIFVLVLHRLRKTTKGGGGRGKSEVYTAQS
jgi:hypothetical protein